MVTTVVELQRSSQSAIRLPRREHVRLGQLQPLRGVIAVELLDVERRMKVIVSSVITCPVRFFPSPRERLSIELMNSLRKAGMDRDRKKKREGAFHILADRKR